MVASWTPPFLLVVAFSLLTHAFASSLAVPALRALSYASGALPQPELASLEAQLCAAAAADDTDTEGDGDVRLLPLQLTHALDAPPEELGAMREFAWVHVATSFKELSAAKRLGAVTVWLNEEAVRSREDAEEPVGFLGAALVDDFADALCADAAGLPATIVEAQRCAVEKAEEEERRARKDHYAGVAEAERMAPPKWDAVAAQSSGYNGYGGSGNDDMGERTSVFAEPEVLPTLPSWLDQVAASADAEIVRSGGGGGCDAGGVPAPATAAADADADATATAARGSGIGAARVEAAAAPPRSPPAQGTLKENVELIVEALELDPSLSLPAAVRAANAIMGIEPPKATPLPQQVAALLAQLGI